MKLTHLKSLFAAIAVFATTGSLAADSSNTTAKHLVGTWFVEVTGVLPDGGAYQNVMNVDAGGTADIVGGWMFGAGGVKFTDSPASVVKVDGNTFEINMYAFLADIQSGAPNGLNLTVYRGTMSESGKEFTAEADLYYLPCTVEQCPAPEQSNLGDPATVASVTAVKIAQPAESMH